MPLLRLPKVRYTVIVVFGMYSFESNSEEGTAKGDFFSG